MESPAEETQDEIEFGKVTPKALQEEIVKMLDGPDPEEAYIMRAIDKRRKRAKNKAK